MVAELLTDASRALDASGNPLAGAKWNFYAAGSSTPQAVYGDAALTNSLSPVVTADAGGKFVPIYFDAALSYRGVLTSSDGLTTIYDISPMNSPIVALLGAAAGSNMIGFLQSGTGAVPRTAQAKMRDAISDADFNTLANAVAAAAGKTLLIHTARTIAAPITLPNGTTVRGAGGSITVTANEVNAIQMGDNCTVADLEIIGPHNPTANTDFAKGNAVYVSGKRNVRVEGCYIHGWNACGVQVRDCANVHISGNILHANFHGNGTAGDIVLYSGSSGRRTVIAENFCLSNNSQGIVFNALGFDADCAITSNVCVTLDSDWSEYVMPTTNAEVRRHGILVSYNGGTDSGRVTITGNVLRNTLWTGVYVQNANPGASMIVSNNVCSSNGFETGNSLSGGIFVHTQGNEIVSDNLILDYRGSIAGIALNRSTTAASRPISVRGNYIANSAAAGIAAGTRVSDAEIKDNVILSPAGRGIDISLTAGDTSLGGFNIEGNSIRRTSGHAIGILYEPGTGQRQSRCHANVIVGSDGATSDAANIGINFRVPYLDVTANDIRDVYYGVHYGAYLSASTRYYSEFVIDRNMLTNCAQGIAVGATSDKTTFPLEGNIFRNCTLKVGGGNIAGVVAGRIGYRLGDKIVAAGFAGVPTVGTWAVGDRAQNAAPAAGGAPGWYCVQAGSPGTWKAEANLAV